MLTAHHVIPDLELLRHLQAIFFSDDGASMPYQFDYSAASFIASADGPHGRDGKTYEFDYALAKLKEYIPPFQLNVAPVRPSVGDALSIVRPVRQENSVLNPPTDIGVVKSTATEKDKSTDVVVALIDRLIFHTCSSYGGDSGGAMVNRDSQVVGIHTHEYVTNTQTYGENTPKTKYNWGTSILALAEDVKTRSPAIFEECTSLHVV